MATPTTQQLIESTDGHRLCGCQDCVTLRRRAMAADLLGEAGLGRLPAAEAAEFKAALDVCMSRAREAAKPMKVTVTRTRRGPAWAYEARAADDTRFDSGSIATLRAVVRREYRNRYGREVEIAETWKASDHI